MAYRRQGIGGDRRVAGLCCGGVLFGFVALCTVVVVHANDALLVPPPPGELGSTQTVATSEDLADSPPAPPMPALIPPPPAPMVDSATSSEPADAAQDVDAASDVAPTSHATSADACIDEVVTVRFEEQNWEMTIVPGAPADDETTRDYRAAYNAVPYRRAEYLANPSYRHDAAMEILFGELRPTVIHRQQNPELIVNPIPSLTQPYRVSTSELWSYPLPPYVGYQPPLSGWNLYPPTYLQY